MTGVERSGLEEGRCTLHIKNKGMKRVRARDIVRILLADQITTRDHPQMLRPEKSPRLKIRKCNALKKRGCIAGLVDLIVIVMGGKTDSVTINT